MASPETGSEKHRDRAERLLAGWNILPGKLTDSIAAALARVEAETLERAARAVCTACADGVEWEASRLSSSGGWIHMPTSGSGYARQNGGLGPVICNAARIRALAPEPVAGDAHPKNETSS